MLTIDFEKMPRFKPFAMNIYGLIPEWARAYEVSEDAIVRQLPYAHGWISSNPKKAPKKDVVRFLFNWMRSAKKWGNLRVPDVKRSIAPDQDPGITDFDLREMHEQKKVAMGCHTQDCRFCREAAGV